MIDVSNIGKSEGENCIYMVKIKPNSSRNSKKKAIIILARQHPI